LHSQAEKVGKSNRSKRNALHLAALYASTEVMDMLTVADIFGIDTTARDKDGHSPNQCFLECRSAHCAITRKPFTVEKRSWARLMASARRPTKGSFDVDEEYEEAGVMLEKAEIEDKDSSLVREESFDSESEEEYADAEDGMNREDRPQDI
jgi:hypothetical protein